MPVIELVDALDHPDPTELRLAGKRGVLMYLKNATRADVNAAHASGLDVGLIWESTGQRVRYGFAAGRADAIAASAACRKLGAPAWQPIYFAEADFDIQPSELPALVAYVAGVSSAIGTPRNGEYGGRLACASYLASRHVRYVWQTLAWSGTPVRWLSGVTVQQYAINDHAGGVGADFDRALIASWGQWPAKPPPVLSRARLHALHLAHLVYLHALHVLHVLHLRRQG